MVELGENLFKPNGSFFFCFSKSATLLIPIPIKYSITAARLLPIQLTRKPVNGPKMAPLIITIGSVGIGVADKTPMSMMLVIGPAIPVWGMNFSIPLMSLEK